MKSLDTDDGVSRCMEHLSRLNNLLRQLLVVDILYGALGIDRHGRLRGDQLAQPQLLGREVAPLCRGDQAVRKGVWRLIPGGCTSDAGLPKTRATSTDTNMRYSIAISRQ